MASQLTSAERGRLAAAIHHLRKGTTHNGRGMPALALTHYCRGLEHLSPLLYSPRCRGRLREVVRRKCRQFLLKASHLRDVVRRRRRQGGSVGEMEEDSSGLGPIGREEEGGLQSLSRWLMMAMVREIEFAAEE